MPNKEPPASRQTGARGPGPLRATDEEIIQANVSQILANPAKLYDHARGWLDAVAVIELAIHERLATIRHYRPIAGKRLSAWSRDAVKELRHEIGMMEEAIRRLGASGITTSSPLAIQLRRQRENPLPTVDDLLAPAAKSYCSGKHQRQAAMLLDTRKLISGVDAGKIRPELVKIAVVTRVTNDPLNLSLTAGWGHGGKGGVTMPGKGRLETRGYAADETASELLGHATHDIFLNETVCWRNVPEKVWDFTIGGYQVIKKWLSYREFELLGRALTPDEAREVTHMARRIAALILLQPELDANYRRVKAETFDWKA